MIIPQNSEWSASDIEQARLALSARVHEDQMERAMDLCAYMARMAPWPLPYAARQLVSVMTEPLEEQP